MAALTLIANPGSASRKYALYDGEECRAQLHFELVGDAVRCTLTRQGQSKSITTKAHALHEAAAQLSALLSTHKILAPGEAIAKIGLRVVAPSSFFLQDRLLNDDVVAGLQTTQPRAPLHIAATLHELHELRAAYPEKPIWGISDSAFHITKPDYAWNYGLPIDDADRLEIKRFGYHGLSVASVVHTLRAHKKLVPKLVVCHLGSGASVTAVHGGLCLDTTMGYSPLEGLIMSTRSGSLDVTAARVLKEALDFDDAQLDEYLNTKSGLVGLGGSADIRELLELDASGNHRAQLALQTYVFNVQKAIGQMSAALGGVDMLVLTGTVGERSAPIRQRILAQLGYLDLYLDDHANDQCEQPPSPTRISRLARSKPIYVVPADEAGEMARRIS